MKHTEAAALHTAAAKAWDAAETAQQQAEGREPGHPRYEAWTAAAADALDATDRATDATREMWDAQEGPADHHTTEAMVASDEADREAREGQNTRAAEAHRTAADHHNRAA